MQYSWIGLTSKVVFCRERIAATVAFFQQMEMPVTLSDADISEAEIDRIIAQLEAHGRLALGEHGDITLEESRKILLLAR